jgi:oligopeptide/dipeptide ABC transporter ATP-binding protein
MTYIKPTKKAVLSIRDIVKRFPTADHRYLTACNHVSLELHQGESLAIVGESGCGKSTLVKVIMRLHDATAGSVLYDGQDIIRFTGEEKRQNYRHMQMVFQDPAQAFNPKMKIRDIVCEPLYNFALLSKAEAENRAKELLHMVELPADFADRYAANMSGGQRQRIAIARALALNPDILICDEATSALDVSVQKKIIDLLLRIQQQTSLSIIFICHDLALVYQMCHRAAVMYLGNIVEVLPAGYLKEAKHPYTQALLRSIFPLRAKGECEVATLQGEIPSPLDLPQGCPFQERCSFCMAICRETVPELRLIGREHMVACHLLDVSEKEVKTEEIE